MIIIVEGIDRVGKTTLCNKLHEQTGIPIYKHKNEDFPYSKMDNDNETDKMLQLLDLYSLMHGSIIFDRFHWSDYAYGIIDRQYDPIHALDNFMKIDLRLNNVIVIYARPENIERSSNEHGRDLSEYNKRMNECRQHSFNKIRTCTYSTINSIVKEIKDEYRL